MLVNIIWQCFTHPSSICISTLQKPCFYLFSHWNPHRTPRVLTPTTASLDALVHAPLRHKRTCGRSTAESFLKNTNPPCDSGEFLNSCHIGKLWKMYAMNNVWMVWELYRWLLRNTKDTQKSVTRKKTCQPRNRSRLDMVRRARAKRIDLNSKKPAAQRTNARNFSSNHI